MPSHPRPLFDSSFAALTLVNAHDGQEFGLKARAPVLRPRRRTVMAMSIRFAPEPEPTANTLELRAEQTTGSLALGFEFELFGVRYTQFELSSKGLIAFGTGSSPCGLHSSQHLSSIRVNEDLRNYIGRWYIDAFPLTPLRIAYEVRGNAPRRRLVLSFTTIPSAAEVEEGALTAQLILHERTGMIEYHATTHDVREGGINEAGIRYTTSLGSARRTA
jgi:hypothetical protein